MKILLTGASGFVGYSFFQRFQNEFDILGIGRRPLPFSNYLQHDLRKPLSFSNIYRPNIVIHAAAMASPWGTKSDYWNNNVIATENVVNFCNQYEVEKLIYLSSSSVFYINQDQLQINENTKIGPKFTNEYARTKYLGEQITNRFQGKVVILRPRAVFGPGDTVLFPRILEAARKKKLPIIKRNDPQAQGDLIYIDNLTHYMKKAIIDSTIEGDFNLTNNKSVFIQQFLFDIFKKLDLPLPTKTISYRKALFAAGVIEAVYRGLRIKNEPPVTQFGISVFSLSKTFDVAKMLNTFGPPPISIDEGVENFIRWQKERLNHD